MAGQCLAFKKLLYRHFHTVNPPLLFSLSHFTLKKDLHLYLFSQRERNPTRIYTFMKKGKKWNSCSAFVVCCAARRDRGSVARASCQAPCPALLSATALNCIGEHRCSISINSVHPLARRVLKSLLLRFMLFRLTIGFTGRLYFWIAGGACIVFQSDDNI